MRTYTLTALLLAMSGSAFAQMNLVLNPDFEAHSFCPDNNNQIEAATFWTAVDSLNNLGDCIPDYCHACANGNNPINSVPASYQYWQLPHSGDGMAQLGIFNIEADPNYPNKRDYLQGRLRKKLTAGKSYCVAFYVSLSEGSAFAIREISAYLDNGGIDTNQRNCGEPLTKIIPQVTNPGGVITDTMSWTKIEGSFVANGKEQFITIGNFRDKAHTTYVQVPQFTYFSNRFEPLVGGYLVDDVSVVESDLKADAGPDRHIGRGDSTYIGRPKEPGLECTWSLLGSTTVTGMGAGIWVRPNATTSYVVTQTLCGQVKKDTVRVEVWGVGISSINGQVQAYTLSPNPNDGNIQLWQAIGDERPVQVTVYNVLGAIVYSSAQTFRGNAAAMDLSNITPGLYNIVVHDSAGAAFTLKFVKK